jgi:hypothetical protein
MPRRCDLLPACAVLFGAAGFHLAAEAHKSARGNGDERLWERARGDCRQPENSSIEHVTARLSGYP